jgi:hypothetical protein
VFAHEAEKHCKSVEKVQAIFASLKPNTYKIEMRKRKAALAAAGVMPAPKTEKVQRERADPDYVFGKAVWARCAEHGLPDGAFPAQIALVDGRVFRRVLGRNFATYVESVEDEQRVHDAVEAEDAATLSEMWANAMRAWLADPEATIG